MTPFYGERMAVRAGITDEDLLAQGEEKLLLAGATQPRQPRKNSRLYKLVEEIYLTFEAMISRPDIKFLTSLPFPGMESVVFDYLRGEYSTASVIKAKKLLGIKSCKRKDIWYWTIPKFAPNESMQRLHDKRVAELQKIGVFGKLQYRHRPSAEKLLSVMKKYGYDALASTVVEETGYKRSTMIQMKMKLGVCSIKHREGWYWVYPAREVQDWLLDLLGNGPVPVTEIFQAGAGKGWSQDVVRMARMALGGIISQVVDTKHCWRVR